jgi:branched-chain amino acid transport system substrate-binding protein
MTEENANQNEPTKSVSRRSLLTAVGAVGAGGLLLGGSVGRLTAPDSSTGAAGGTGSTEGPIKIGLVAPITGPYSGDGQDMVRGQELGIAEINANGGVHGRQLELVKADVTDLAPENYVKAAQRLTGEEKVAAVFSGYCTNDSTEFPVYADAGVPMFHLNTLQANVDYVKNNGIKNIYEGCPTEVWYGKGFVPLMQSWIDSGQWTPSDKSVAVVTSNDPYSISIANALSAEVKKIGWAVPVFEQVTAPTADWGPVLSKIRAAKPGLIFVTDYIPGDLASFATQFASAPTQSLLYQQYGPSIPEYLQLAGDAGNDVIWSTTIGTLPDEIGAAFLSAYKSAYGADAGLSQAGGQYDLVRLWAQAASAVSDPMNFESVNASIKRQIFRGVSGIYRFDPEALVVAAYPDQVKDASLGMPHLTYQIQNQKQVPIAPDSFASGSFKLPSWIK